MNNSDKIMQCHYRGWIEKRATGGARESTQAAIARTIISSPCKSREIMTNEQKMATARKHYNLIGGMSTYDKQKFIKSLH